ncbi:DNA helicase MCM9, putative [Plasmodium knowlesi strain H]|uniref:DNA helicase MCM9, putative n=3 Tax=Plasmodium knowlesi TaxID=5850 RepID=A0A5K1VRM1_PLAKH|nr:DNA helicase MCM9, putative [Plasmodium knowlesi strain H]OTN68106.1 putative DNA helicase MCM9 [Plasmodium knowlesi]CAA9986974.1 DNA helicase MCM9, putative [Plasmodium knowlesi strain H]SBO26601.1 DNA helicase MCM9, putative [Plasmodium knowlesi strain H]SBO28180.1 DNA helicase MCM9, putative [Plasmodium knowlesi strain H]VVS76448.1 DNA helicase MCM9, putative [Plasmodium knowlesi strain H]|eukprot:XP_002258219.1 DNA replication licensing factor, putative [Plasmodium knowlesi strain H]
MLLSSSESSIFSDTDYDVSSEDEYNDSNGDENIKNVKFFNKIIIKLFLKNKKYYEQVKKIALSYISKIEDIQFSDIQNPQQVTNEHIYNFYFDTYDAIQHGENKLIYYMQNSFHKFIDVMNNYSIPFFFRLIFLSCYFEFLYSKEVKKDVSDSDRVEGRRYWPTSDVDNKGEDSDVQWIYADDSRENDVCSYGNGDMLSKREDKKVGGKNKLGEKSHAIFKGGGSTEGKTNQKKSYPNGTMSLNSDEKQRTEEASLYDFIVYNFSKDKMLMEEIDAYSACLIKGLFYLYKDYAFLKDENTKAKINNCLKMIFDKQNIKIMCRVENVPYLHDIHINYLQEIRNKHIGKFVSTEGIITRVGEKKILEECKKYRCIKCDHIIKKKAIPELYYNTQMVFKCPNEQINTNKSPSRYKNNSVGKQVNMRWNYRRKDMAQENRTGGGVPYIKSASKYIHKYNPHRNANYRSKGFAYNRTTKWNFTYRGKYYSNKSSNGNRCNGTNFEFLENEVKRVDYQEIKIKETAKTNIPYSITVVLLENLAGKYHPGKKVIINGIILRRWKKLYKDIRCEAELFIEANNVEIKELESSRYREVAVDDEFAKCINALMDEAEVCGKSTNIEVHNTEKQKNDDVNNKVGDDPEGSFTEDEKGRLISSSHLSREHWIGTNRNKEIQEKLHSEEGSGKSTPSGSKMSEKKNKLNGNRTDVRIDVPEKNLFEKYWLLFKDNKLEGKRYLCDSICPNLYNCKLSKISVLLVLIGGNRINEYDSFYNENNKWKKYFNRGGEEGGTRVYGSDENSDKDDSDDDDDNRDDGNGDDGNDDDDEDDGEHEDGDPWSWENAARKGRREMKAKHRKRSRQRSRKRNRKRKREKNFSSDNSDKRTLCHLLLVGDPGTGKSQLLREVQNISHICTNVSGMFCTTAGLTCAAIKEGNAFMLESGALVLADNGVCCIDEFCLMKNENKNAIHEAMEQLTISVAKGGIVDKLNCRCTIIGASNFELHKTPMGNLSASEDKALIINLSYALLSRFDMIVVTEDNSEIDSRVADYVLSQEVRCGYTTGGLMKGGAGSCGSAVKEGDVQTNSTKKSNENYSSIGDDKNTPEEEEWAGGRAFKMPQTQRNKIVWSSEKLKEYIYYVKNNYTPNFNENSKLILITYYSTLRKDNNGDNGTTVRTLESLIRLSEAHSKMMHTDTVSCDDVINVLLLSELSLRGYKIAVKTNSHNVLVARAGIMDNLNDSLLFYNNVHRTFYSLDDVLFYESLYNYFKKLLLEKLNLIERNGQIHRMAV